jgi:hypothetical protein
MTDRSNDTLADPIDEQLGEALVEPLVPGLATGIGSLPHTDARAAAAISVEATPHLPAAPQLPNRNERELMLPQWAAALPEIEVGAGGRLRFDRSVDATPPEPRFDATAHGGLLAFVDLLARRATPIPRVKLQLTGPLTLGLALCEAGMPATTAFRRAAEVVRAWIPVLESLVATRLPGTGVVLVLDEPGLVAWRDSEGPIEREAAVDLLSGALASVRGIAGVHVCGAGDRRLVLEAGPHLISLEVAEDLVDDGGLVARYLDGGGWVAWGAIPTDGPIGDSGELPWRRLAAVWCELTRRGCDPVLLRTRAVITPACGLAGHGPSQAVRALCLASTLADRVHDQAVAARLTLGA